MRPCLRGHRRRLHARYLHLRPQSGRRTAPVLRPRDRHGIRNSNYLPDPTQDVADGFAVNDTHETFGSIVNDDAIVTAITLQGPEVGSEIDYLQFGGGFANEWVSEPGVGMVGPVTTDLLITPFGDFTLLG